MNFDKMLEYQKMDQELLSLENALKRSDEAKRYMQAVTRRNEAGNSYNKLNAEAGELLNAYAPLKSKLEALKDEIDDFDGILDDVQDIAEAEHYLKIVGNIADQLATLEKEASRLANRIEEVSRMAKKFWEQGVAAQKEVRIFKAEYDKKLAELQPRADEIKAALNSLIKEIDPSFMKAYMFLREAKKLPAFVEYSANPKNPMYGYCPRCTMALPNDAKSKLKNPGDYAECPDCRRILFIPEDK